MKMHKEIDKPIRTTGPDDEGMEIIDSIIEERAPMPKDKPSRTIEEEKTNSEYIDTYVKSNWEEILVDGNIPDLISTILEQTMHQIQDLIKIEIEGDLKFGDRFGVDEEAFINAMLDEVILAITLGALPDDLQYIIDAYRLYNSVSDAQEVLADYYSVGDTVGDTLFRILDNYRNSISMDLNKPISSKVLSFLQKEVDILPSTWKIGRDVNRYWEALLSFTDQILADSGWSPFDYEVLYKWQSSASIGMIAEYVKETNISWSEFSKLLAKNLLEVPDRKSVV